MLNNFKSVYQTIIQEFSAILVAFALHFRCHIKIPPVSFFTPGRYFFLGRDLKSCARYLYSVKSGAGSTGSEKTILPSPHRQSLPHNSL